MNLTAQLTTLRKQTDGLSRDERAKLSCDLAKQLEKVGEYDFASQALHEFWPDQDQSPHLDGLNPETAAQVLQRVGALAGWVNSAGRTGGSQDRAKDLITRS